MSSRGKIFIGILLVLVLGSAVGITVVRGGNARGIPVRMEEVATQDLVATVTVSGNVRARRAVDISADVMGRVIELNVEEGDDVTQAEMFSIMGPWMKIFKELKAAEYALRVSIRERTKDNCAGIDIMQTRSTERLMVTKDHGEAPGPSMAASKHNGNLLTRENGQEYRRP